MAFCIDSSSINLGLQYNRFFSSKNKHKKCQKKGYMIKVVEFFFKIGTCWNKGYKW
jgi:hypothetical protein